MRLAPIAIALSTVLVGTVLHAQQPFRARAEAVRVDVLVTRGGKVVRGLTAGDFEVRDSGVVQQVRQIEIERLPLNIMLVLDTSSSVEGRRLESLLEAGRALVESLDDIDRVALLSFSTRVRLLAPLTGDRNAVISAFGALKGAGFTSLRDAAFAGLALREADPGRTLLLLFSDGADTSSWLTRAKVIDTAKRTDVVVYPIGVSQRINVNYVGGSTWLSQPMVPSGSRLRSGPNGSLILEQSGRFLDDLADATGGRVMLAGQDADLRGAFLSTLAEFRDRYVLSYEPAGVPAAGWHPIDVKLKGTSGKVTARRGYFSQ